MTDADALDEPNFFRDPELVADPYPFFEAMREECPVRRESHEDVVLVTGYPEALAALRVALPAATVNDDDVFELRVLTEADLAAVVPDWAEG